MSTQRGNRNSDAIRILQRDRDASARATHLKAEIGMVPNSTIERKIMSTKTSIKRIALVAAAALTLGGFTAVSASAANTYVYLKVADGITSGDLTNTSGNGVAGPGNYVIVGVGAAATSGILTVSGSTFGTASNSGAVTIQSGATSAILNSAGTSDTVTVNTPSVGSITVNFYKAVSTGVYSSTVTESVVITVAATAKAGVYNATNSSVYIGAGETFTALTADATTPISKVKTYNASDSATATILVNYFDGVGTSGNAITYTAKDSITATITSGPGTIYVPVEASARAGYGNVFDSSSASWPNIAGTGVAKVASNSVGTFSASALPDPSGRVAFMVFANGAAGVTTVTIKNTAGTVLGTKTVTFTGTDISSVTMTTAKAYVRGDAATATHAVFTLVVKDSAGNAVSGSAWSPTVTYSDDGAAAGTTSKYGSLIYLSGSSNYTAGLDTVTSTSTGALTYGWNSTAATYGKVTVTVTDPTTKATASATITQSNILASKVTVSAPASVDLGNTFSYTVTATDSNGYNIPDGTALSNYLSTTNSTAYSANGGIGAIDSTTVSKAGIWTLTVTGPIVAISAGKATFTLGGTAGTATTYLASTIAGTAVTADFAVAGAGDSSSLAYDAASAATDAANNAYEEAQNATQAASDALAAVQALAVQVKALIALVNKIKAKLKA